MLLFICLLLQVLTARATVYTVINNADSGVGTLRDMLTQAAANTGNGINYIYFNLPGAGPVSQTIIINTGLPVINSSIIIDGTTQPGATLSVNGAKVAVQGSGQWSVSPYCFEVLNATDFEMYGMIVKGFFSVASSGYFTGGAAISLEGKSDKVIIGAVGRGNVFYNDGTGILNVSQGATQLTPSDIGYCEIKANLIGIEEDGVTIAPVVQQGIGLSYVHQSVIGGATQAEGNDIEGGFICSPFFDGVSIQIQNNIFGANQQYIPNGLINSSGALASLFCNAVTANQVSQVTITNNVFGTEFTVSDFANINLQIQSNYFGISPDGSKVLPLIGTALNLTSVKGTILVGGIDITKGNTFSNAVQGLSNVSNGDNVVESTTSENVELSHNTFYCNNNIPFLYKNTTYNNKPITVTLDNLTNQSAGGVTKPNARVELFYTDQQCTQCQPKTFIAAVNADASGNWNYKAAFLTGYGVMVAATLNGISSEFTDPRIYADGVIVTPVTCTAPGSITGMVVVNGNTVSWVNNQGIVIGNSSQLTNAPAGIYHLVVNQFGCVKSSVNYTVEDLRPLVDDKGIQIQGSVCSGAGGSITGLVPNSNVTSLQWVDAIGNVVGTTINLTNVKAGAYTLQLTGVSCHNAYGPVVVLNTVVPAIVIAAGSEQINPDQCGLSTGSIKNIQISGGVPPYKYNWQNSTGVTIGTGQDIMGLGPGTYNLIITDAAPCDMTEQTYHVGETSAIIPAPSANDVKVCGNVALIRISNPVAGNSYRLYNDINVLTPLAENSSGMFAVHVQASATYYITRLNGACESVRTPVNIAISNSAFSVNNTFTPNGDGINDYWEIKGLEAYTAVLVQVFNRYGQMVYRSENYARPFDGTYNGRLLPSGTYYYIINLGSGCKLLTGSLTIVR